MGGWVKGNNKLVLMAGVVFCFLISSSKISSYKVLDITHMTRWLAWTALCLVLAVSLGKDLKIPKSRVMTAFLLYLVMSAVSLMFAYNTTEGIYELAHIVLVFISIAVVFSIIKDIKDVAKTFTIFALIIGVYGVYYIYFVWDGRGQNFATMGQKNTWSQLNLLLLPLCLYMVFRGQRLWRIAGILSGLLTVFHVVIPQTRSAILGMGLAIAAALFVQKRWMILLGLSFLAVAAFFICHKANYLTCPQSLVNRFCTWKQTCLLIRDKFIVGAGNWQLEIPLYAEGFYTEDAFRNTFTVRPHNDYLWVAAEASPVGAIFYISFLLFALYCARGNPYLVMGLVGYMTISFFSFPKERAPLVVMMIFYVALALSSSEPIGKYSGYMIAAMVLVLAVVSVRTRAELISKQIHIANNDKNWSRILDLTEGFWPASHIDTYSTPIIYYRGIAFEQLDDYKNALIAYSKAGRANYNHLYTLGGLGICHYERGDYSAAQACYEKALVIKPDYEGAIQNLRQVRRRIK